MSDDLRALALASNAWPFEEARKVLARLGGKPPAKGYVLFETGYGPSGLPHIGTFGEVARTTMVRNAFKLLSDIPTKLIAFSDDMDGLRRVPDNVPNQEMVAKHLGKPLTSIPDPFGTHESFGHHNNARLRVFLDTFGFDYEFKSATAAYKAGEFDETLLKVLAHYDAVMAVMLPTLGPERRATYSPFLPVSPKTGQVLQVPIVARDVAKGTVTYQDEDGTLVETPVTGGRCKLQWKVDWAMRWAALGVDYEMSGKDLIDSVKLSTQICRIIGGRPPESFTYELFLDDKGQKISKSKGNGLTVDEWLRYAPPESLALYMYNSPRKAKRLFFDVIPRHVDDYLTFLEKFAQEDAAKRLQNPVWHIHAGNPPQGAGAGQLRHAAQPGERGQRSRQGAAVELHLALRAGRVAGDHAAARPPGRLRGRLLQRFRQAGEDLPQGFRRRARGVARPRRHAGENSSRRHAGRDPEPGLRSGQAPRLRRPARLLPVALRNPARPDPGPAHGLLHRALRREGNARADSRDQGRGFGGSACPRFIVRVIGSYSSCPGLSGASGLTETVKPGMARPRRRVQSTTSGHDDCIEARSDVATPQSSCWA